NCTNAIGETENTLGTPWAQNWLAGQIIPSGWQLALDQPSITFTTVTCPQGQQQATAFNFTASSKTHVNDAAYNPAAAQALAGNRLSGLLPAGCLWESSSQTTCTPAVKGVDGNNKVTLSCAQSGTAYYNWTDALRAQLAGQLAGQSKASALATCGQTT